MKKWGGLSVRVRLISMVAISVAGLLMVFGMALSALRVMRVQSVLSKQDRLLAVMNGDFENPLTSVLNAYPIALQAQKENSREAIGNAQKTVHEMRGSYEQWFADHDREVTDPILRDAIKDAQVTGQGWYDLLENEYFPALAAGRTDDAVAIWQSRMEPMYGKHHAAIVKITDLVKSGMDATDRKVDADESKCRMWMGVVTGPALLVVLFIGLVTARYGRGWQSQRAS